MARNIDAVLLDFDHTIAHLGSFVRWEDARAELLPLYRASGVSEAFLQTHEGALSLYGAVAAAGVLPEAPLRETQRRASRVLEAFEREAATRVSVLPAASAFLRRLPELGLRAGIVTSNNMQAVRVILERDGVAAAIEAIVGRDDVARLKPSPEGLRLCCEAMSVAPERCIYAGDSVSDIEAALAAGMASFGVLAGMSSDAELSRAGAEAVFDDLGGLLGLLEDEATSRRDADDNGYA
ncbi:MAG: HAD family hydrolase [Dehalococcoidia bacterium]